MAVSLESSGEKVAHMSTAARNNDFYCDASVCIAGI
jgi:hypothetical protein